MKRHTRHALAILYMPTVQLRLSAKLHNIFVRTAEEGKGTVSNQRLNSFPLVVEHCCTDNVLRADRRENLEIGLTPDSID